MLDFDLAQMYEVETRVLNQSVKRNIERFPDDFMFQLTKGELDILKVVSSAATYQYHFPLRSMACEAQALSPCLAHLKLAVLSTMP